MEFNLELIKSVQNADLKDKLSQNISILTFVKDGLTKAVVTIDPVVPNPFFEEGNPFEKVASPAQLQKLVPQIVNALPFIPVTVPPLDRRNLNLELSQKETYIKKRNTPSKLECLDLIYGLYYSKYQVEKEKALARLRELTSCGKDMRKGIRILLTWLGYWGVDCSLQVKNPCIKAQYLRSWDFWKSAYLRLGSFSEKDPFISDDPKQNENLWFYAKKYADSLALKPEAIAVIKAVAKYHDNTYGPLQVMRAVTRTNPTDSGVQDDDSCVPGGAPFAVCERDAYRSYALSLKLYYKTLKRLFPELQTKDGTPYKVNDFSDPLQHTLTNLVLRGILSYARYFVEAPSNLRDREKELLFTDFMTRAPGVPLNYQEPKAKRGQIPPRRAPIHFGSESIDIRAEAVIRLLKENLGRPHVPYLPLWIETSDPIGEKVDDSGFRLMAPKEIAQEYCSLVKTIEQKAIEKNQIILEAFIAKEILPSYLHSSIAAYPTNPSANELPSSQRKTSARSSDLHSGVPSDQAFRALKKSEEDIATSGCRTH